MAGPQASFAQLAREDGRAALVTAISGAHAGERLLVRSDGSGEGSLGDSGLEEQARADAGKLMWAERSERRGELFVDVTAPGPRVLIFGAVAYANHLAHLARMTGWRPYVIDPRSRFATRERLPDAIEVIVAWPERALEQLGGIDRATYLAVLSNDPKIDDEILRLALSAQPAYIGAMGSHHAQAQRRERLLATGVPEATLRRIGAPVGLDLGALSAEETALSIMAELVAVRHGRGGGRLSRRRSEPDGPAPARAGSLRALSPGAFSTRTPLDTIREAEYSPAPARDGYPPSPVSSSQLGKRCTNGGEPDEQTG
ncbi:MAG: XdhC family protein [Solirubrobacteraceae bacterium]